MCNSRSGDVTPGVLCFTTGDGDNLGTDEGEGSVGHHSPPGQETALVALNAVELRERAWVFPVAEAETVMVRASTEVEHDTKDNQTGDSDNLDRGEDEFCLSV